MPRQSRSSPNGASPGFESGCWKMADKLRTNMDAAEFKHVILGLIFLQHTNYVLTPGSYVGAEIVADEGEPSDEKMKQLTATLGEPFAELERLEKRIRENLREIGYGI